MRRFLLLLSCVPFLAASAQTEPQPPSRFESTVVDERTHQPLPMSSVHVSKSSSTIANIDGSFTIACDSDDVLHISYVGYQPLQVKARHLPTQVKLKGLSFGLQEVTVRPISETIRQTTKETLRQLQKHRNKKAMFFYRQTAFSDTLCYEFAEAFLKGHSAAWLRDLELLTGRFAGIQPDSMHHYSYYGNFFTFSQIEVATKDELKNIGKADLLPLSRYYTRFYDVDYEIITHDEGRLYAIHFTPKPEVKRPILEATLYVDEATHHLRRIEGTGRNIRVLQKEKGIVNGKVRMLREVFNTEYRYIVNMTETRGFLEVQSVFVDECHEMHGKQITTRSLLFNLGDQKAKKGQPLKYFSKLQQQINEQGYDPKFWKDNEVVRRTPVEQQVMQLFEQQNLFGVFK